jgi:hypothetical protein
MTRESTVLARRFRVDVNSGTPSLYVWTQVLGILEVTPPKIKANIQKTTDYDDGGWEANEKTGQSWSVELAVRRKQSSAGAFDPGQEVLRAKGILDGADAEAQIRIYDREGGAEAYQGSGIVEWEDDKGKQDDTGSSKITITGNGILTIIANPAA